jgi:excisionase family DNA binding protein
MELLTVQEAAAVLKVSQITVRRYIADGRLAAVRIGRGVRVRRDAIDRLAQPVEPVLPADRDSATAGRALTFTDPLWQLVGSATDAAPSDATKKYEYLFGDPTISHL